MSELRRLCQQMVPHWTWSVCPLWIKPHSREPGCPWTAAAGLVHKGGWTLWAGRSLNSHGLAHLPVLGCLPSPSFLRVALLADNSTLGRTDLEGLGLVWGGEVKNDEEVMRHKPQESVLAHSTTIYNPGTGLALRCGSPRNSEAKNCCCLVAMLWNNYETRRVQGSLKLTRPVDCKISCPLEMSWGRGK